MKQRILGAAFVAGILATGCATGPYPLGGIIYHDLKGPNEVVNAKVGTKTKGESCATSILGYVVFGDASMGKAQEAGKITQIGVVDYSSFNVLGVYGKTCAIVHGT